MEKFLTTAVTVVLTAALLIFINSFLIEWTWNGVISPMFHVSELTWFKSWQLGILGSALFGGGAIASKS
jgi:succinate dehydrogenase hydrophobic anchor subunit